jgi:hypothetical protein
MSLDLPKRKMELFLAQMQENRPAADFAYEQLHKLGWVYEERIFGTKHNAAQQGGVYITCEPTPTGVLFDVRLPFADGFSDFLGVKMFGLHYAVYSTHARLEEFSRGVEDADRHGRYAILYAASHGLRRTGQAQTAFF